MFLEDKNFSRERGASNRGLREQREVERQEPEVSHGIDLSGRRPDIRSWQLTKPGFEHRSV